MGSRLASLSRSRRPVKVQCPKCKVYVRQDHYQIMRAAVDFSIPYITTIQAARAIDAIKREKMTLEPIGHYLTNL
jgi:hypothetical protein